MPLSWGKEKRNHIGSALTHFTTLNLQDSRNIDPIIVRLCSLSNVNITWPISGRSWLRRWNKNALAAFNDHFSYSHCVFSSYNMVWVVSLYISSPCPPPQYFSFSQKYFVVSKPIFHITQIWLNRVLKYTGSLWLFSFPEGKKKGVKMCIRKGLIDSGEAEISFFWKRTLTNVYWICSSAWRKELLFCYLAAVGRLTATNCKSVKDLSMTQFLVHLDSYPTHLVICKII